MFHLPGPNLYTAVPAGTSPGMVTALYPSPVHIDSCILEYLHRHNYIYVCRRNVLGVHTLNGFNTLRVNLRSNFGGSVAKNIKI